MANLKNSVKYMEFVEYAGNASTTGFLNGRRIGRNVSVAVYRDNNLVKLVLESNGARVSGVDPVRMTAAQYEEFLYPNTEFMINKTGRHTMLRALDLFGVTTAFDA